MMKTPRILVFERTDELAKRVGAVTGDLRPRPEVVTPQGTGTVNEVITDEGPFDLLVAGPVLGTKAGLQELELARDCFPGMSIMLAFAERPAVRVKEIVRTGAVDLVQLPASEDRLREAVVRALELSRGRGDDAGDGRITRVGRVTTIASATGGAGKTFFATNLAYFLHRHTRQRVCIVDLDLQFGEVAAALRVHPAYTIIDALQGAGGEEAEVAESIDEYVVRHESGVELLAAPRDPSEADRVQGNHIAPLLEVARRNFDHVIVDTASAINESMLGALDVSDDLFVLATLDVPSIRNLGVFLTTLEKLKVESEDVRLVMNKIERGTGIDATQATKLFPQGFSMMLPYDAEVSKSINMGNPVLLHAPRAEVSRLLTEGLTPVLPERFRRRVIDLTTTSPAEGLLAKLFRREERLAKTGTESSR